MTLYFSATGNCKYVATHLTRATGQEMYAVADCIRNGQYDFSGETIGIVSPPYDWGLPGIVKEFLEKASFQTEYLYFIATYGTTPGAIGHIANKTIRGRKIDAYYSVRMADTWTPIFDLPPEKLAKYGSYGALEDVTMEEAKRQFDVNLFGMARLIQCVIPYMRENHYGKIVNISSMGGKIWTKFGGWYHATKLAVEGFSDCLRMELKPFGIDVVVVEPGGIKTDWGIIAAENLKKTSANGAYAEAANKAADGMIKNYSGNMLSKPELIAKTVRKAVTKRRPRTDYLI